MAKKALIFTAAHEKFCQVFSEVNNGRVAFMAAWPDSKFSSSSELASRLLKTVEIQERIEQIKEEITARYILDKDKTIIDLIKSAEEAKEAGQFGAYGKLREMVIKIQGLYAENKVDITTGGQKFNINLNLNTDTDE